MTTRRPPTLAEAAAVPLKAGDDCPRCRGELMKVIHNYQEDGGCPDCTWLYCLDCHFETEPE